ncbi:MAG: GMC family oxidoreductase N-terminal domain-containing protein [Alphaproteobacteria bacterium]
MTKGFDYIIVGAGTAGCVLASRLSEDPSCSVCLIEAGDRDLPSEARVPANWPGLQGSAIDWGLRTEAQKNCASRVHDWPRGKVLGGSTAINAMAHMRGHPADFDAWAEAGLTGWGYADLLPYFIRSETSPIADPDLHGSEGPVHLIQPAEPNPVAEAYLLACREQGLTPTDEHNGREMCGPTMNTLTIRNGERQTIADAYLPQPVLARPNLSVMTNTRVTRLLLDRGTCTGVETASGTLKSTLIASSGVILCAGAIATPCLLQRSGIGNPSDLKAAGIETRIESNQVGYHLHDHLLAAGNVYRARKTVPPSNYQHSESATYIRSDGLPNTAPPDMVVLCVVAPVVTECFEAPAFGEAYTLMFGATHPKSRGRVTVKSDDPSVPPFIDPAYLTDPDDRNTALAALDWARRIGHSAALDHWRDAEILPTPTDLADRNARENFLERVAYTHHHPVATCRMGVSQDSAVDPMLRLRGVDNAFVVDASVIPSIPTGPINAAIIAIAEKAADLLTDRPVLPQSDWRHTP